VDLLDTAAARVKTALLSKPEEMAALESELAGLDREREALRRDVAEGQRTDDGAAQRIEERTRGVRDRLATLEAHLAAERAAVDRVRKARAAKPGEPAPALEEALAEWSKARGDEPLVHADVDAEAVARVVASWTGIPVGKMSSDNLQTVLDLEAKLAGRVRGQPQALRTVAEVLRTSFAGIRNPGAPVGVLLFVGPSGVGKTETAIALAELLYGGERFMTSINMSEFQEKHTVSRLIGSPPGYVGFGEGGLLTEAVRQRPYSVVLLDECEKADLEVMNLFYQVFDKGILTDGEGREIDFKNTLVVLTSNLATDQIMDLFSAGAQPTSEEVAKSIRPLLSRHFKPALLARMTVVPFLPLPREVLREVVELKLGHLARRISESQRIAATFAPELVASLADRCADPDTGARNVDHVLRGSLLPELSRALLEKITAGEKPSRLAVGIDARGGFKLELT